METFTSKAFEDADRIRHELEALADPAYRDFQAKLVPTVDPARILGVRTPARVPRGAPARDLRREQHARRAHRPDGKDAR